MKDQYYRKHYGIEPCTNPIHRFHIGPVVGQWQWGNKCWCWIDSNDCENTVYFHFGRVRTPDFVKAGQLIVWRFKLIWSWTWQ